MQLAELAAVGKLHGELEIGDAAPLGAGLEDPAEMVHGVGQGLAIGDGQAAITRLRLTRRQPGLAVWSGDQRPALDDSSEPAPPGGKS